MIVSEPADVTETGSESIDVDEGTVYTVFENDD